MLIQTETWTISSTASQTEMPKNAILVFDSTGTVIVNGDAWGTWTGSASPYALQRNDGQNYLLRFDSGTQGHPDELTCWLQMPTSSVKPLGPSAPQKKNGKKKKGKKNVKSPIPKAEAQGSSWTAQGGTQGGNGGSPAPCLPNVPQAQNATA